MGLIVVLSAFTFVHGQSGTTPATRGRTDPVQREIQRRFESDAMEQALAREPGRHDEHERRRILAQIREDFLSIQIVNDELQRLIPVKEPLDLEAISRAASKVVKLAQRLKDNLELPKGESISEFGDLNRGDESEQLRSLLSLVSNSIRAFVENPVFERARVVDAQLSLKAQRDLQQVIAGSKQIKKRVSCLKREKQ